MQYIKAMTIVHEQLYKEKSTQISANHQKNNQISTTYETIN